MILKPRNITCRSKVRGKGCHRGGECDGVKSGGVKVTPDVGGATVREKSKWRIFGSQEN